VVKFFVLFCILLTGFPNQVFCLELTLKQAIDLALINNPALMSEKIELINRISKITEKKADYIPKFDLSSTYTREEDQPSTPGLEQDDQDYKASITQKLPLGGELSFSYAYGLKYLSSYQSEITSFHLVPDFSIEPYTEIITTADEEKAYTELELSYTHHLLKNGLFGPAFVPIKEARFDHRVQEQTLAGFQIWLINNVKAAFWENVIWQRNVKFSQEILETSQKLLNLITSRYEIGLSAEIDVMTARVEMNRSRQELLSSLKDLEAARKELKELLGTDEQLTVVDPIEGERKSIELEEAVSLALEHNRQLLALKHEIEKQELAVKVASNNLLPQVDLFTGLRQIGWGSSFDDAKDLQSKEYHVGLIFSYPLYNRGLKENYRQKGGELKKLKLRQKELEIEITNSVSALVRQLNLLDNNLSILSEQLDILEHRLNLALHAFDEGLISLDQVYDARDDMVQGKKGYLFALLEYHQQWSILQQLMGKSNNLRFRDSYTELPKGLLER
jgi:outer membrane protein TolC